jgi:hypothetical protein
MMAAIKLIEDGLGLRVAARQCNVPVETLRRRVVGAVGVDCKPGPPTVLTPDEEVKLVNYIIDMSDMGFGLTRQDVMRIAYQIVTKSGRPHPFQNGSAGRSWFESFQCRHPNLTLRSAQPLSFARAAAGNKEVIADFFAKLGAICARLNLLAKPMQIFNVDETGISVVHKPGKVLTELGRRNVWEVTSAERGKTHTVVTCVSASGFSVPPMLIYPRKRLTERLKNGAFPGTLFACSDNGWINQVLYLEWFRFFVASIPPTRPVLLIEDGHSSHISLEVIKLAKENHIHLLCLPSHTTHLLQPLDVGVFRSLKSNFSKMCKQFLAVNPGQVITTDLIASLLAKAWPLSVTPVNVMSGFKKCGIYPLNPGEISDRQLAPSRAVVHSKSDPQLCTSQFTPEQIALFQTRYEEGFDLEDSEYAKWLRTYHPEDGGSVVSGSSHGVSTASNPSLKTYDPGSSSSLPSSSSNPADTLSEILVLPKPKPRKPRRQGLNTRAVLITDDAVVKDIEKKQEDRRLRDEQKERRRIEREKRKEQGARKRRQPSGKQQVERKNRKQKSSRNTQKSKESNEPETSDSDGESDAECKKCGLAYRSDSDGSTWICCDFCNSWYHWCVLNVSDELPYEFVCV